MFRELFELYLKDLETENKESSIYEWFLDNMSEEYCVATAAKNCA